MENIFNNDINVMGGVSATTLSSPTLDAFTTKQYVDDTVTLAIQLVSMGGKYTGRADVEGLRKIGWTNEDIWYYQLYGVNWNREDDELHKVPQNNIDLYGVINASNIQTYKANLVYLPKIDTSQGTNFLQMFYDCYSLTAIPLLNTSKGTNFDSMFWNCRSLTSIPLLNTSQVTNFGGMFNDCPSLTSIPLLNTSNGTYFNNMFTNCTSLTSIPLLNTSKGTNFRYMFRGCTSLTTIPLIDTSKGMRFNSMFAGCSSLSSIPLLNTSQGTDFNAMFYDCSSLSSIPLLNTSQGTKFSEMFYDCPILSEINLQGLPLSINLSPINQVTIKKESILFIINNSTATSAITIRLNATNYNIYSVDADVKAALANKQFVTLIQA